MNWSIKEPSGTVRDALTTEQLIRGLQRGELSADIWLRRQETEPWQPLAAVETFENVAASASLADESAAVAAGKLAFGFSAVAFAFAVGWLVL